LISAQASRHTASIGQIGEELNEFRTEQRFALENIVGRFVFA